MGGLVLAGCATYQGKVNQSREFLSSGRYEEALQKLQPLAEKEDGDQLVYLLDYGTALHMAGQYQESNKVFLKADKLSELVDYHSVSRVAGSMLLNEEMVQYKGDTFEKIFINAYLALNFLQLGQLDSALVETRRMNEKYIKLRSEDKQSFELNPFAKYLSALIWEADQKWDDAYIAYEEAYKLDSGISGIQADLIRSAKRARRMDQYNQWKTAFPQVEENPLWSDRTAGELVIIYQQGWGPRKAFNPMDFRFPVLKPIRSETQTVRMDLKDKNQVQSQLVYDTEKAAIKTLQEDSAALLARRLAGIATKEVVSDQIRQKNELLGAISNIVMHASDRADLRQWSTLPQTIQIIRVPLKPGIYSFSLQGLNSSGAPTSDHLDSKEIKIVAGKKYFMNWRSLK